MYGTECPVDFYSRSNCIIRASMWYVSFQVFYLETANYFFLLEFQDLMEKSAIAMQI